MRIEGVGRLSSAPAFFHDPRFLRGALSPRSALSKSGVTGQLRAFTSSHWWYIDDQRQIGPAALPSGSERRVCELATSLLQRGAWTLSSWRMEQYIASLLDELGARCRQIEPSTGTLGYSVELSDLIDSRLRAALVTGRLPSEAGSADITCAWSSQATELGSLAGSDAERNYFSDVLAPTLGFPHIDFVRCQATLTSLGVHDPSFVRQRVDFAVEDGRGLRLVVEVDGAQHETSAQLDAARDRALSKAGWRVLRVKAGQLPQVQLLSQQITTLLPKSSVQWRDRLSRVEPRATDIMTVMWGATVAARIQYLLLHSLLGGLLNPTGGWRVAVDEAETRIAAAALRDFDDWFGRLRSLHGLPPLRSSCLVPCDSDAIDLFIDVAVTQPWRDAPSHYGPIAVSRPFNGSTPLPTHSFSDRGWLDQPADDDLLASFAADVFRKPGLREGQAAIINRALCGQDVIGLLPTGGGKSLTYQLPALLLPGCTLYVSPLKSLIQDQKERLIGDGIDAVGSVSSALSMQERVNEEARFAAGQYRCLLVAPERFLMRSFRDTLSKYRSRQGDVAQVVVDECHCVSEWGHDFRPAYLSLGRIVSDRTKRLASKAPLVALTGTASSVVLNDVQRELNVLGAGSVVRARRMDRPELALQFKKVSATAKLDTAATLVHDFLGTSHDVTEGCLLFSRFVGNRAGTFEAYETLVGSGLSPGSEIRFYSADAKIQSAPTGSGHAWIRDGDWDLVKSKTQRDFISPFGDSFRVLVATHAFGMGIDKPSIRRVIHLFAPPSPEAYYQEVGRAGRDGRASEAYLLLCDDSPELVDRMLSPASSLEVAREAFQQGGRSQADFMRTFFFHATRFLGKDVESSFMSETLRSLRHCSQHGTRIELPTTPATRDRRPKWSDESPLEYSIVRLVHLGVVADYEKEYSTPRRFIVELDGGWVKSLSSVSEYKQFALSGFRSYVQRYEARRFTALEARIEQAESLEEVDQALSKAAIEYLYTQIEERRRAASRQMLELARKGVRSPDEATRDLMLYLQVSDRFASELESVAKNELADSAWFSFIERSMTLAEWDELRGACQRVLESYPLHPVLLFVSAVARRDASEEGTARSMEDFAAALAQAEERVGDATATAMGKEALRIAKGLHGAPVDAITNLLAIRLLRSVSAAEAFSVAQASRMSRLLLLNEVIKNAA